MKILQVVHGFPPRDLLGSERYTYNLSKELSKHHEVFVFYPVNEPNRKNYSINKNKSDGLQTIEINNPGKQPNYFRIIYALFNIKSLYVNKKVEEKFSHLLQTIKPDVVHFQHLTYLSTSLVALCKEKDIPIVLTLHDFWFICPQTQLLRYNEELCDGTDDCFTECVKCFIYQIKYFAQLRIQKFGTIGSNIFIPIWFVLERFFKIYYRNSFLKRNRFLKDTLNKVDLLIAPSNFLRDKFIEYGVPMQKIILSNYGMTVKLFDDFARKDSRCIRFGFVGGIAPHKGLHILIEAFNKIHNNNVELRIYGFSTPIFLNYYELTKSQCRNPNIKFMEKYEDAKIPFSEIDVLVFPSLWYENCPLALQEAFITKTPVIGSKVGAIPEFVEDYKTGLLFERNNPDDLYKKMKLIIDNPQIIEQLRKNIKPVKTIEEQGAKLEKIYKNLSRERI